ncbi:VirB4-like conjugal transfer ATPase, CD1110 family [Lachnoclostridium sp. An138]|uniref:VirB4-like conjugal transfer ATPase, CD1110 family n=1 Tax=Lachnoclostridium sp. An138 TaxID=1965560 RepID=UPI000B38533C|nr:conjugal transfer protein TraE [Lachnoclostridium sp. An138]
MTLFTATKNRQADKDGKQPPVSKKKRLSRADRRQIEAAIARANRTDRKEKSAQDSIPYERMWPDGICRVADGHYTKTIQFQDINYQLSQNEDKAAIFEGWCDFLNYFDSSIQFQLSFLNLAASEETFARAINIPLQGDDFDTIRVEYMTMLQNQLAKGNNGLIKTKYLTFGVDADSLKAAKPRLERIETDILNNFKRVGVAAEALDGKARLAQLHGIFHMDEQVPFRFEWEWLAPSGLSTKDFIAPSSFEFRTGKQFRMGKKYGAVSFLQILAPELNDRMLADFLDMESSLIVSLHIQSVDQIKAIKTVKRKITDLDKSKIEEQKKAVRAGYDMDIIPSDLATYGAEAKKLLQDLQSRNERMFLVTFLVLNTADNPRQLDNNVFQASSIAQKYNCQLTRLDFQQEEGLMSALPLGLNQIEIQRGLTTSSTAIFVPFTTQELFQSGKEALYYGINALSNNLIMVDRKLLKNPNGLILGTPGCFDGETRILLADGSTPTFAELVEAGITEAMVKAYDYDTGEIVDARAIDIRIEKYVDELKVIELEDGTRLCCTDTHLIMDADGQFIEANKITDGQRLSGGHVAVRVAFQRLPEKVPVYDLTVPKYGNFLLANGLIVHNSGKSFSAKREIANCFLLTNDDIIICDPEAEYAPLVERLHGQVIKISPTSSNYINPMDLNLDYSDDESPLSLKSDFILSLCELIVGGKEGLQPVQKTIIDRCVRLVYQTYLNDPRPENMPILEDLYNLLRAQDEKEAQYIATALEIYVTGSLNVFNHQSNVDINNRIVCYDIKELGKQLKKIGMLVVQDQVWNRVTINRAAHKSTRYYIDEMHLLLKEEQTAAYTVEIWKRFRKWGGIPTGITQNVKDLLSSREVENIFENSDFVYMLNQAGGDRQILAKQLGISPHQLSYVTHSSEGEGLLFYGSTILPFVDHFPKNTELYRIMTTKPQELKKEDE